MNQYILDTLKRQGAFAGLLLLIAWVLFSKLERMEERIQNCEAEKFKIITENNERSNVVIDRNTVALDRNTEVVETLLGLSPSVIYRKKKPEPLTAREGLK